MVRGPKTRCCSSAYARSRKLPASEALPGRLGERIKQINTNEADLMKALGTIAGYALDGTNGLKDRTGLLEHRYDAV
jgi:hypothetical protein